MANPTIAVNVTSTTDGLQKGLAEGSKAVQIFAENVTVAGDSVGEDFAPKADDAAKQTKNFGNIVAGFAVGAGLAFFNVITKGVGAMTSFIKGGVLYAAQVDQMRGTLEVLGRQQGITADEMKKGTEEIRDVGIETGVAQQMLAQFTRMQFEVADAVKIAAAARDLATMSDASTTETAAKIMHGIQTRQTDVLRTAGVNIGDLNSAYREYAETLDKTAGELTQAEQSQAIYNAVLKEAAKVEGAAEEADKNAIKRLGSMVRIIKEISLEMAGPFLGAFSAGVGAIKGFVDQILIAVREGGELRPMIDKMTQILDAFAKDFEKKMAKAIEKLPEMIDNLNATADSAVMFGGKVAGIVATVKDVFTALIYPIKLIGKGFAATFEVAVRGGIAAVHVLKSVGQAITGNVDEAVVSMKIAQESFNQMITGFAEDMGEMYSKDLREAGEAARNAITGLSYEMAQSDFVDRFTGNMEEAGDALDDLTERAELARGQMTQIESDLVASLKTSIAEQLKARWAQVDAERQIAAKRAQIQQQYIDAMNQAQVNYERGIQQAAVDHGKTMLGIQEEYEKAKSEIMRQWEMSRDEAIRSRDAMALVEAERQRDEALAQAEADKSEQEAEAGQSYHEQINSLKIALEEQQEAARNARAEQSAALAQSIAEEAAEKARAAEREKMLQEVSQAESLTSLQQYLNDSLRATYATQLAEYTAAQQHYARMSQLRTGYQRGGGAQRVEGGRPSRGYQSGTDYVPQTGTYLLHKGEAVVPASENRRGGGASKPTVDQSGWTFNGPISEADKDWFRQAAQEQALNTYAEIAGD